MIDYLIYSNAEEYGVITHFVATDGRSLISMEQPSNEPDCVYLYSLNVYASARQQGRADDILGFVEDYIKKNTQCNYILLEARPDWISEWYKRKGFVIYKYNNEDKLNMFSKIIKR